MAGEKIKAAEPEACKSKTSGPIFSKRGIIASKRCSGRRDVLETLLEDGGSYTLGEAEKIIRDFDERKVH